MGLSSAASNGNVSEWVYFKAENPQTWDILAPVMIGWSVLYRFNSSNISQKITNSTLRTLKNPQKAK